MRRRACEGGGYAEPYRCRGGTGARAVNRAGAIAADAKYAGRTENRTTRSEFLRASRDAGDDRAGRRHRRQQAGQP